MQLNDHFLTTVGLGALPEAVKPAYLRRIHDELMHSVGVRLAREMTAEQFEKFEALQDGSERVAAAWLHIHYPSHSRVVREECDAARRRLTDLAPQTLALELAFNADSNRRHMPAHANAAPKEN